MDGYLATNVAQLRKMFAELLRKIQDDEEGFNERIGKMIR